jgi:hypothetical protein
MEKRWHKTGVSCSQRALKPGQDGAKRPESSAIFARSDLRARRCHFGQSSGCSSGEACWVSSPVAVERESVDHQRVPDEVQQLAFVADTVRAAKPECVVEVAVDALGVVARG